MLERKEYYKVVSKIEGDRVFLISELVNHSSIVKKRTWITAESGIKVLDSREKAEKYMQRLKDGVIVSLAVYSVSNKERSGRSCIDGEYITKKFMIL